MPLAREGRGEAGDGKYEDFDEGMSERGGRLKPRVSQGVGARVREGKGEEDDCISERGEGRRE